MGETLRVLWTTRAIAEAAGVWPASVLRVAKRFVRKLRPSTLRRHGPHPRRHRVFDVEEARFILQVLVGNLQKTRLPARSAVKRKMRLNKSA